MKLLPYFFALGLFSILLTAGFLVYKDFGVPVDEPYQLELAIKNHRYIFHGDPVLLSDRDRYHGAIVELPLFWVATRFTGPETVYVRHILLYLAFLASLVIFYLLSLRLFHNPWWGLLAVSMLAVSPRIFSDTFYNSKDIAFMDVFILAIWTLFLVIDVQEKQKLLYTGILVGVHAFTCSLLIDTRIAGMMIVPISVLLLAIANFKIYQSWRRVLIFAILYLTLTTGLTILFWPVLWHNPFHEFINAFQQLSKYEAYGKAVIFQGHSYPSDTLPWQYLPVWIGISTPIIVLAGFIIGFGDWIRSTILSFQNTTIRMREILWGWISDLGTLHWLTIIGWLAIPIFTVYLFHSVLYNGWRHLFFIYPAVVLFSVRGFSELHKWLSQLTGRRTAVTVLTVLVLAMGVFEPLWFLVRYYRYGTVYFNQLAGDPATIRQRFETDYWGLSYKEAIDFILSTDKSSKIPIYMADVSGLDYINSELPPEQKARLVVLKSPDDGASYFVGNFSFHPDEYQYSKSSSEYYSITVQGMKILVVYKFH
jgi:hypothetical protein